MKNQLQVFGYLVILLTVLTSGIKNDKIKTYLSNPGAVAPLFSSNREYFLKKRWEPTTRGYEIQVATRRLTQDQICRGMDVGVAMLPEWSPWVIIPLSYQDAFLLDTVHLSYDAVPGRLNVIATASFELTVPSDVYIEYK